MIWRVGPLCIVWKETVIENATVVIIDRPIKIEKPVVVEVPTVIKVSVEKRVEVPTEIPHYDIKYIDHQVIVPRYKHIEKPVTIIVEKPVVEIVEKKIVLERTKAKEQIVEVPVFSVKYGETQEVEVPLDSSAVIDIECLCGATYKSSMTKCIKCGKSTQETLREIG